MVKKDHESRLANRISHSNVWISNLLDKANTKAKKNYSRTKHHSIQHVFTKFEVAIDNYIKYCQTCVEEHHEKSILAFSKIPFLEKIQLDKEFLPLLKLVQKINNVICINFPHLHIPPGDVVEKMVVLLQSLNRINNTDTSIKTTNLPNESKIKLKPQCLKLILTKQGLMNTVGGVRADQDTMSDNTQKELRNDLNDALKIIFPKRQLHIFGSRATRQALSTSDFDIYCDITGDKYFTSMELCDQKDCVKKVAQALQQKPHLFTKIVTVPKAKVPIVKLVYVPAGIDCDISFKDGTAVENSKLVNVYLNLDPRVRWVLTAVKMWADANEIKGSRYFTSHGLSWFVLFYLMQAGLVPPVRQLQSGVEPIMVEEWNVAFKVPVDWKSKTMASEYQLFKGFFSWVVSQDLRSFFLSTYTGEVVPNERFNKNDYWKTHYSTQIISRRERNGNYGLCVPDAFQNNQNIVRKVKYLLFERFIDMCNETNAILNQH